MPAISGSLPGRISESLIRSSTNTTANKIWMGIRNSNFGDTDFNPLWECEDGTHVAPAALGSDSDNASPLGTTDNIITYASTTDDVMILSLRLDQASSTTDWSDYYGDYNVLLRCKLSAAQSVKLQLKYGMSASTVFLECQQKYIDSTDWHFVEMGKISLPPWPRLPSSESTLGNYQLRLHVQRIGTATTLSLDCFVLVPADHQAKFDSFSLASLEFLQLNQNEDGTLAQYQESLTDMNANVFASVSNWYYPIAGGQLVLVSEDTSGSSLVAGENELRIDLDYYTRYRTHGDT
jgi:hypothetical protein